jgi:hypothetical protein
VAKSWEIGMHPEACVAEDMEKSCTNFSSRLEVRKKPFLL